LNIPLHPRCTDWILDRVEGLLHEERSRRRSVRQVPRKAEREDEPSFR
jgi:hypothetical protein